MSRVWTFNEAQLEAALAAWIYSGQSKVEHVLRSEDADTIRQFLDDEHARKLCVEVKS